MTNYFSKEAAIFKGVGFEHLRAAAKKVAQEHVDPESGLRPGTAIRVVSALNKPHYYAGSDRRYPPITELHPDPDTVYAVAAQSDEWIMKNSKGIGEAGVKALDQSLLLVQDWLDEGEITPVAAPLAPETLARGFAEALVGSEEVKI